MASLARFDKQNLRVIRADMDAAFASVAAKHGISLSIGNIRFTADQFTTKLTSQVASPAGTRAGVPKLAPVTLFRNLEAAHGPGAADAYYRLGRSAGIKFIDYRPSAHVNCYVYITVRGTKYVCSEEDMRAAIRL